MMQHVVEVRGLTKAYQEDPVLSDIDLDVRGGECLVFLGPSGAGKSTFLRCVAGLEEITHGSIFIQGERMIEKSKTKNTHEIGMVFQQFNLFPHLTAKENVTLGLRRVLKLNEADANKRALELLERVGLARRADYYPLELSGGQQQRVAIARALAMEPTIMLFDEVTSSLDPEHTREVLKVMNELAVSGMTLLVVTHEMGFAQRSADRIVFMEDGRVVEVSDSKEFFLNPKSERARSFLDIEEEQ